MVGVIAANPWSLENGFTYIMLIVLAISSGFIFYSFRRRRRRVYGFIEVAAGAAPRQARREDRAHGETILVVEDRAEVAELARLLLEDAGYGVLVAGNAREGLVHLEQAGRVDLLFTDLIMPGGMNGVALAREARRRRPHLKVLLTTGYAEAGMERQDVGSSGFELINKPYRRAELLRRVRQVLEGPTGVG